MRIAVDAAGGSQAPFAPIEGARKALASPDGPQEILLVGDPRRIQASGLELPNCVTIVPTEELVTDAESPVAGLQRAPRSTIVVAHELVKTGRADAVVSAGSTGAQLAAAVLQWGKLRWLVKPALGAVIPRPSKRPGFLLDVGANPNVAGVHLAQFAAMGAVFAEQILGIRNPRIGLLSNGEEPNKGTDAIRNAHQILRRTKMLNFVGNLEGGELFGDKADVIVTDGFTGNVFLKFAESLPSLLGESLTPLLKSFDATQYGGVPILGVQGVSIVCHGNSNSDAFAAAILEASRMVQVSLTTKMETLAGRLRWQRFRLRP